MIYSFWCVYIGGYSTMRERIILHNPSCGKPISITHPPHLVRRTAWRGCGSLRFPRLVFTLRSPCASPISPPMFTKKNTCNNSVTLGVKWWSSRSTHQISCFRPVLCVKSFCKTAPCLPASDLRHSTCATPGKIETGPGFFYGPSHVVLCPSLLSGGPDYFCWLVVNL